MEKIEIQNILAGVMRTNCYLVSNKITKETIIIDPADEADKIKDKIKQENKIPIAIFLTHGHFDHIKAAEELKKEYGILIYCMEEEKEILENSNYNLSILFGKGREFTVSPDIFLKDKQELELGGLFIQVLYTPGHTIGSCCYYITDKEKTESLLLSGDTLFYESVGRTDFPTGSTSVLVSSITEKLFCLEDSTPVYPGHEGFTTIGHERIYNPCVKGV